MTSSRSLLCILAGALLSALLAAPCASAQTGADTPAPAAETAIPIRYVRADGGGSYSNDGLSWATAKNNLQVAIRDLETYINKNNLDSGYVYVGAGTYVPTESTEAASDGVLYTSFSIPAGIRVYGGFAPDGIMYERSTGSDGKTVYTQVMKDGKPVYQTSPDDRIMDNGRTQRDNNTEDSSTHEFIVEKDGGFRSHGYNFDSRSETILSGNHVSASHDPHQRYLTWNAGRQSYDEGFPGNSYHVVWFATNGFHTPDADLPSADALKLMQHGRRLERREGILCPAEVNGFTITGGFASNKTQNQRFHNSYGGGVYMVDGAELRNCRVTQCAAAIGGGGVYLDGGGLVENCYIYQNQSSGLGLSGGYGGGVYMEHYGMVRHCVLAENCARVGGGVALSADRDNYPRSREGEENYQNAFAPILAGLLIVHNTATAEAGGILMQKGGTANHLTIARNHCDGANVNVNNRRYGRSGGLYIDIGATVINSVCWGNTTKTNREVQYASYTPVTNNDGEDVMPYICFSAFSHHPDADWTGTYTENVIPLAHENRRQQSERGGSNYYPDFQNPDPIGPDGRAGVDVLGGISSGWTAGVHYIPETYSDLATTGLRLLDYVSTRSGAMSRAQLLTDINGRHISPRTAMGVFECRSLKVVPATGIAPLDPVAGGGDVETLFVDPDFHRAKKEGEEHANRGDSWHNPLRHLCDALHYAGENPGKTVQIFVKEGVSTVSNRQANFHSDLAAGIVVRLRDLTANIPAHTRVYGGFYGGLGYADGYTDPLNISLRNPVEYPSELSAAVSGLKYKDNAAHVVTLSGADGAIVDGFHITGGNTTPDLTLADPFVPSDTRGAGIRIHNSNGVKLRNLSITQCTASEAQGAAIYADGSSHGLELTNVAVYNNTSGHPSAPSSVHFEGSAATMDHCLLRGNVGAVTASGSDAALTVTNSAFHANTTAAHLGAAVDGLTAPASDVMIFGSGAGTVAPTGSHCLFDAVAPVPAGFDASQAILTCDPNTNAAYTYPIFANPTTTIGAADGVEQTYYGGRADFMPRNMNPMVNYANDPMPPATDMTAVNLRHYGGAADVGPLECIDLEPDGKVIYVTPDGRGDFSGRNWANALPGNAATDAYKSRHTFAEYDREPYAEGTQLTGLQWAVDEAYYRSLKKDAAGAPVVETKTVQKWGGGGSNDYSEKEVKYNRVASDDSRVQVWVGEGEYTRPQGYIMRDGVDVYGGFPLQGNPGLDERDPSLYVTTIQTNTKEQIDDETFTWGRRTRDLAKNYVYAPGEYGKTSVGYDADGVTKGTINSTLPRDSEADQAPIIDFGSNVTARYLKLKINNGHDGTKFVRLAELQLYSNNNREVTTNRSNWKVYYSSQADKGEKDNNGTAKLIVDGNATTYWHSEWATGGNTDAPLPHILIVDFGETLTFRRVKLTQDKPYNSTDGQNRWIKECELSYGSEGDFNTDILEGEKLVYSTETRIENADTYDLNGSYNLAYGQSRVLTQPFPYFLYNKEYTPSNGSTSVLDKLECNNVSLIGFDYLTTWNGFTIRHGRTRIQHQRDGGAGVALRHKGRLENCIIENNINQEFYNIRGGGIFLNGGELANCIVRGNSLYEPELSSMAYPTSGISTNVFGGGLYLREGVVYNTSFYDNAAYYMANLNSTATDYLCGSGVFFENGRFYNNTIVRNRGTVAAGTGNWFGDGRVVIYNTIIHSNYRKFNDTDITDGVELKATTKLATISHCLMRNKGEDGKGGSIETSDATISDMFYTDDPGFQDLFPADASQNPDLGLKSTSLAINSALEKMEIEEPERDADGSVIKDKYKKVQIELPEVDAEYTARIKDCALDIGAYEFDGTSSIAPSLAGDPDTEGEVARFYVSASGYGLRTGTDPANAACADKLQKVLDKAGQYKHDNPDKDVRVLLAEYGSLDEESGRLTAGGYRPVRLHRHNDRGDELMAATNENPRSYSIVVPQGVTLEGGWNEANRLYTSKDEDGNEKTETLAEQFALRDPDEFRTYLTGLYTQDKKDVAVYHVVSFTRMVYNDEGNPTDLPVLTGKDAPNDGRAILDGLFITNGDASGDANKTRQVSSGTTPDKVIADIDAWCPENYGGAALVPSYGHLRNCVIEANKSSAGGGALMLKPRALVSGCIFRANTSDGPGGAVYVMEPSKSAESVGADGSVTSLRGELEVLGDAKVAQVETPGLILTVTDPTCRYANVFTSTFVDNTSGSAGGAVWFDTNLRMNSSVLWFNSGTSNANIAGQLFPKAGSSEELDPWMYPLQYCAVENLRPGGYNNIELATLGSQGVRWDWDGYENEYNRDKDEKLLGDFTFLYLPKSYSRLTRAGMYITDYGVLREPANNLFPTLEESDIAGVMRTMQGKTDFIDIGARTYDGIVKVTPEPNLMMTRLFVASTDELGQLRRAEVMQKQQDSEYYRQRGSSMAYPMNSLDEALEYVRLIRQKARDQYYAAGASESDRKTAQEIADHRFEIFLSDGTYQPFRTIDGKFSNTRANTFLVPEGVSIYGGISSQDFHLCGVPLDMTEDKETWEKTFADPEASGTDENGSVKLKYIKTETILAEREVYDVNQNGIIEGWGLNHQSILSGNVVNSSDRNNSAHVITVIAAEKYVGLQPTPLSTNSSKEGWTWDGTQYAERGWPVILDGLQITEGQAIGYDPTFINLHTYYKGGAISVDGNWLTNKNNGVDDLHMETTVTDQEMAVGYRDIPLVVRNSLITNNKACMGGAIYTNGELHIYSSQLSGNTAESYSETIRDEINGDRTEVYYGRGGAAIGASLVVAVNTIFANNSSLSAPELTDKDQNGVAGALAVGSHGLLEMLNCHVVNNEAQRYPAVYVHKSNTGYETPFAGSSPTTEELIKINDDNPHQIVNTLFWGNTAHDKSGTGEWVLNPPADYTDDTKYPNGAETLWFCAYEDEHWFEARHTRNMTDRDFRTTPYTTTHTDAAVRTFIPYVMQQAWAGKMKEGEKNPEWYNFNVHLSDDNNAADGPNFITPSIGVGATNYMPSADWMMGRINNMVDQGWTYLSQTITGDEAKFDKTGSETLVDGSGIYVELAKQLRTTTMSSHYDGVPSMPVGDELYMQYDYVSGDDTSQPRRRMLRVSLDPNPSQRQTYIDIGAYEYQHVPLNPTKAGETDILWVSDTEKQDVGVQDGSTWKRATSDLQRAVETLLASRNGRHKEIRLLEGKNYMPVYTISGNVAYTINTFTQNANAIIPEGQTGQHGVRSLTLRGGYSSEVEGQYNALEDTTMLRMAKRAGANPDEMHHLFVIQDATQRTSETSQNHGVHNTVVPVIFEAIHFSNTTAGGTDGASAIWYKEQRQSTITGDEVKYDPDKLLDGAPDPWKETAPWEAGGKASGDYPKLTLKNCRFVYNGSTESKIPAVRIDDGGGRALVYNTLFADNTGGSIRATKTSMVNCTLARNSKGADLDGSCGIHNSILWENGDEEFIGELKAVGDSCTYNAISKATLAASETTYHNDPLSEVNDDVMEGPNFTDPDRGDYSVLPGVRISSRANALTYWNRVFGPDPGVTDENVAEKFREGYDNPLVMNTVDSSEGVLVEYHSHDYAKYRDLAEGLRLVDGAMERGAFESPTLLNRVLYVAPGSAAGESGLGVDWGDAYPGSKIQTAINAAAVYAAAKSGTTGEEAYVFVKGHATLRMDGVEMHDGVKIYGSVQFDQVANRDTESVKADTDSIEAYVRRMLYDPNRAMAAHTVLRSSITGIKAAQGDMTGLIDGFEVCPREDPTPDHPGLTLRKPAIEVGPGVKAVGLRNLIVRDFKTEGCDLVSLDGSSLLYNTLIRDCEPDPGTGAPKGYYALNLNHDGAYALNVTVAVKEGYNPLGITNAGSGRAKNMLTFIGDPTATEEGNPFAPYFMDKPGFFYHSDLSFAPLTRDKNLWYQLSEESRSYLEKGEYWSKADEKKEGWNLIPESLRGFYNFDEDRDLLGNPRVVNKGRIDFGCFETWTTGNPEESNPEDLILNPNRDPDILGGNFYPHPGSVVYIQKRGTVVLPKEGEKGHFTAENPFNPGFLLLRVGGSLYAHDNTVALSYVAMQRHVTNRYSLVSLPYAFRFLHHTDAGGTERYTSMAMLEYPSGGGIIGDEGFSVDKVKAYVYDGAQRSAWDYVYSDNNSPCWQEWDISKPMPRCQGWLLDMGEDCEGSEEDPMIVRFTAFGENMNDWVYTEGEVLSEKYRMPKEVDLIAYDDHEATSGADFTHMYDMGWNLKGLPYLISDYRTGARTSEDGNGFAMSAPKVVYRMKADGSFDSGVESWGSGTSLKVTEAFFAQTALTEGTGRVAETVKFVSPVYTEAAVEPAGAPAVTLSSAGAGGRQHDAVVLRPAKDEGTLRYALGRDGAKMGSLNREVAQIYAVGASDLRMGMLGRAPRGVDIPLGICVPEAGEWLLAAPESEEWGDAEVWLTDHASGVETPLLAGGAYKAVFENPGTYESRFTVRIGDIVRQPELRAYTVRGRDGHIEIEGLAEGDAITLYTVDGVQVDADTATGYTWRRAVAPGRVYIVRINTYAAKVLP